MVFVPDLIRSRQSWDASLALTQRERREFQSLPLLQSLVSHQRLPGVGEALKANSTGGFCGLDTCSTRE